MDYDAYDALLHHIFKEVTTTPSMTFRPFVSHSVFADAR
jgi:hypothetical protein